MEILRATYEAANRGDWNGFFAGVDPNIELKAPDRMMRAGTHRGTEEVRQFLEELLEPFEEVVVKPEKFLEAGDRLVVFLVLRARPTGSSAVIEIRIGHLWTMRDSKAVQLEIFPERERALQAAGLSERDAHADS